MVVGIIPFIIALMLPLLWAVGSIGDSLEEDMSRICGYAAPFGGALLAWNEFQSGQSAPQAVVMGTAGLVLAWLLLTVTTDERRAGTAARAVLACAGLDLAASLSVAMILAGAAALSLAWLFPRLIDWLAATPQTWDGPTPSGHVHLLERGDLDASPAPDIEMTLPVPVSAPAVVNVRPLTVPRPPAGTDPTVQSPVAPVPASTPPPVPSGLPAAGLSPQHASAPPPPPPRTVPARPLPPPPQPPSGSRRRGS